MRGVMLIFRPADALSDPPEIQELIAPPSTYDLHRLVDGYIERVPWFDTFEHMASGAPKTEPCVAFCNDDGKRRNLPVNRRATLLWEASLQRQGSSLRDKSRGFADILVGTVVVLTGDDAFMKAL